MKLYPPTRRPSYVPKGNNLSTHKLFSMPQSSVGTGYTFQLIWGVPFYNEPVLVRAVFENDSTSQTYPVNQCAFSSGRTRETNPKAAVGGADVPWVVSGSVPITVPVAGASFATDGSFGVAYTPWNLLNIQPRTDGKTHGLIYVRAEFGANARGVVGNGSRPTSDWSALTIQQEYISQYQSGSFTAATQTSFAASGSANSYYNPMYLQTLSAKNALTICNVGDSTSQGYGAAGTAYNYCFRAAELLSTPQRPVVTFNMGQEGKASSVFLGSATTILADLSRLPSVMIIQPFSENNAGGYTQSNAETAYAAAMQLALLCVQKGVVPMLRTLTPTVSISSAGQEAVRVWVNSAVRAGNMPYFDYDAAVTDGASIARIQAAMTADGIHPNDAGHAAAATRLISDLAKYGFLSV